MATRVEVSVSWGSTVVQTLQRCPASSVRFGDIDSAVPAARLGGAPLPLVVVSGGEVRLVVWPAVTGTVTLPGRGARRLDRFVTADDAASCAEAEGMPTIPLPSGSIAEIALSRDGSGASPYRAAAVDDRLVFHVAVSEAPRPLRRRAAALRHAAMAGLALSVLAHFTVFATEPDPVLEPTEVERVMAAVRSELSAPWLDLAVAEREGEGEWDRIHAPLDLNDGDPCLDTCCFCSLIGPPKQRYVPPGIAILSVRRAGNEREGFTEVPRELTGCFARPSRSPSEALSARVTFEAGPDLSRAASDPRPRRRFDLAELWGSLAVDDNDVPRGWEGLSLRAPRARRPTLAFGAEALEILSTGLERASSAFAWCYQRAREDDPTLQGRVAMRLGRGGAGVVDGPATEVKSVELGCCLENAQRLWTARVRGDGELRYAIDLRP